MSTSTMEQTTSHRLEGPDLDDLLAQVRAEHGPDAVIVEANKLRSGGVGGFFAKEAFEVVVAVPDGAHEGQRAGGTGQQGSTSQMDGIDALIEAASAADVGPLIEPEVQQPSAPRMSTEGAGFAGVLDRMVRDAGVEPPRAIGPSILGTMPGATVDDAAELRPAEVFEPLRAERLERQSTEGVVADTGEAAMARHAAPTPQRAPAQPRPALDERWLARVGVPAELASKAGAPRTEPVVFELLRLMEQLPQVPSLPRSQGSVIVVAGVRADAMRTAELLAAELEIAPEEILVAAETFRGGSIPRERRLNGLDAAMEQRRSWRRRTTATLVAVDAGIGRLRGSWARHVLDALEPNMVWGVVEATRKAEDIGHWAERLGGLDALAVNDVHATVSPASVLATGIPVGLLDGHPASASRWTALLAEQLELAA